MDIKKILKSHGWTISAVSKEMGITQSALSQQITNKSITFAKVEQIAGIVGIPLSEFVNDSEPGHNSFLCPYCGRRISIKIED